MLIGTVLRQLDLGRLLVRAPMTCSGLPPASGSGAELGLGDPSLRRKPKMSPGCALACLLAAGLAIAACGTKPNPPATDTWVPPTPPPATPAPAQAIVGAQVAPDAAALLCDRLLQDHVAATILWVYWGEVDQGGGHYRWDDLDASVDQLRACGMEVAVHIQARQRRLEASSMPQDLDAYTRFVAALVGHLKGRVRRYAIENEAMSGLMWSSSPEDYFQLLDLAHKTIKAADPEAMVLDSGPSSAALGIAQAHSLYQAGQRGEALALVQESLAESGGEISLPSPKRESSLEAFFQAPRARIITGWMPLLAKHQGSCDAVQFHWYGSWQRVPDLVAWMRSQGITRPLEAWELGRRYPDPAIFDEALHAQETARLLATAAGEGMRFSVLVPYVARPQRNLPGLVTTQGPRPADTAFRVAAQYLNGVEATARLDLGPSVWAYRLTGPQGDLYAIWTTGGEAAVRLPVSSSSVTVIDVEGAVTSADPANLRVSPSPVFVVP